MPPDEKTDQDAPKDPPPPPAAHNSPRHPQPPAKGQDMSSSGASYTGPKARGDTAEGKDDPNTENDGDNGPGSD